MSPKSDFCHQIPNRISLAKTIKNRPNLANFGPGRLSKAILHKNNKNMVKCLKIYNYLILNKNRNKYQAPHIFLE